ncbi:MAG: hypothetical protein M3N53_06005 [Actinomycetota bacterium]|nr:hypothetical protein [Actinomycetota bacterium]
MTNADPFWMRLRALFEEKGIDPNTCLFDLWSEDTSMEEGWVVTSEGEVYGFDLTFGGGDIASQARNASLTRWNHLTHAKEKWYPREDVELALSMVRRPS